MSNPLEDRGRRRENSQRKKEVLADLAAVLALREGRLTLARILRGLGLGRAVSPEESLCLGQALGIMENISQASPEAARKILHLVYGLEKS